MNGLSRRHLLIGTSALLFAARARASSDVVEISWGDLIPGDASGKLYQDLRSLMGIVGHGELPSGFMQQRDASVTTAYDGERVRIPGYMVPLEYDGVGVKTLLLVPYVGACIHVPPPPPNQIVLVSADEAYEVTGYFEPIYVTGTMATTAVATDLAEIGYTISDALIEPY